MSDYIRQSFLVSLRSLSQPRDRRHDREFRQILRLEPERLRILVRDSVFLRLG
jgi:hypothetical protein